MANNTTLPAGTGGDSIRDIDKGGVKTQVFLLDLGGAGAESLATGTIPVSGTLAVSNLPAIGPNTSANSQPVVLASDQVLPISAVRRDADTTTGTDGVASTLYLNDAGRLKVSVTPADIPPLTGSITTNGGLVAIQVRRFSNLSIQMTTSALAGHNISFEASNTTTNGTDGTWVQVQVVRSNANTVETTSGVLAASPVYMWQVNVSDYAYFRVRATAHTSGTAVYTINPSAYVSEPVPAVQVSGTQPVSGTVTATVANATFLPVTPTTTFTNSAATTNATLIKSSAGTVWSIVATNTNASARYLKLYNKATAPTVGTDVPVLTLVLAPAMPTQIDSGSNGLRFATGIGFAITGAAADTDTTVIAAAEVKVATTFT